MRVQKEKNNNKTKIKKYLSDWANTSNPFKNTPAIIIPNIHDCSLNNCEVSKENKRKTDCPIKVEVPKIKNFHLKRMKRRDDERIRTTNSKTIAVYKLNATIQITVLLLQTLCCVVDSNRLFSFLKSQFVTLFWLHFLIIFEKKYLRENKF